MPDPAAVPVDGAGPAVVAHGLFAQGDVRFAVVVSALTVNVILPLLPH